MHNSSNVCVLCWLQAVERLNIKPKHFRDLLTDEPFTRGDIITLQDPMAPEKFDVAQFYHVVNKISLKEGKHSYWSVPCTKRLYSQYGCMHCGVVEYLCH